jgi:S1-C subfamily serine protease
MRKSWWFRAAALAVLLFFPSRPLHGQAADVPIFDDEKIVASLTQQAVKLRTEGRLIEMTTLARQRGERAKCRLALAQPSHETLKPPQVCVVAHRSTWIVGVVFHCESCAEWHFSGATGYAISADGALATCAHVIAPDPESKDEFVVAADPDGVVHPVIEVLAADLRTDVCIVRVEAKDVVPLALRTESRPGETVYCYGHPQHHFGFFSEGEIARFAWEAPDAPDAKPEGKTEPKGDAPAADGGKRPPAKPGDAAKSGGGKDAAPSGPPVIVMEITAEFAAGSSGSPVLDACGNVVGHAAATEAVFWDDDDPSAENHQMTLRIVTVARDVLALIDPIAPPPASPAK